MAAVTLLFAVATLASDTIVRPLVGLDLVEDHTAEMMESMKADMVSYSSQGVILICVF